MPKKATTTAMRRSLDWHDLPFREIWCVDFEYYPGTGTANGGREGDAITPLCLVALELRTGRIIRQWRDEFGPFPPYRLDGDALFISYMVSAEFGCHIALGWGQPACALDAYVEFRHYVNDGTIKSGDREKGFYSLDGALRYFCENGIDTAHKTDMRDRIIQGPPFTAAGARDYPGLLRGRRSMRSRSSFSTSCRRFARCRTPWAGRNSCGPLRSRNGAAFRSICRSSAACDRSGLLCKENW